MGLTFRGGGGLRPAFAEPGAQPGDRFALRNRKRNLTPERFEDIFGRKFAFAVVERDVHGVDNRLFQFGADVAFRRFGEAVQVKRFGETASFFEMNREDLAPFAAIR